MLRLLATTALFMTFALSAGAQQKNQKDDGQQNQNGDGKKKEAFKTAELKAQPGKLDFGWFAPKAKGNVLQNNQLGKAKVKNEGDDQNNQKDDGQKNQKDDGQKNQNGDKKVKG